jgi:hypothetical protein
LARWQHQNTGRQFIKSLGKHVEWERGQVIGSIRFLALRWEWSRGKVENFLEDLKKREMVFIDVLEGIQRITLVNYERYNELEGNYDSKIEIKNEDADEDSSKDGFKDSPKDTQIIEMQEDKGDCEADLKTEGMSLVKIGAKTKQKEIIIKKKEEKIYVAEKVTLTKSEHEKLFSKFGEKQTEKFIEKLNAFKLSKNKEYASDYATILNWVVGAVMEDEIRANKLKNEIDRSNNKRAKGALSREVIEEYRNTVLRENGGSSSVFEWLKD